MANADDLKFRELRETNVARCEKFYHPISEWSLTDWMVCVAGEVGELAGVIKNIRRTQTERVKNGHLIAMASIEKIGDESADIVIYLDLLCAAAGVDLGAAVRRKFDLVSRERLGTGPLLPDHRCTCGPSVTTEQAIARAVDRQKGEEAHDPACPLYAGPQPWSLMTGARERALLESDLREVRAVMFLRTRERDEARAKIEQLEAKLLENLTEGSDDDD